MIRSCKITLLDTMTQYTYLLALLLIVLTGSGLTCYMLYIHSKKTYFLLTEKNQEILAQISGLEQTIEKLTASEKKLKEINKNKDRFFSIISHDLRGPLNSITGLLQILVKYVDSFSKEELKDFGRNMDKSVRNLLGLLDNLFQWSQTQNGSLEYRPQQINLYALVQKTVNLLESSAQNKNIEIIVDVDESLFVQADADMVSFTIRNLLSNAIKFTNKGGKVHIFSTIKNNNAELAVSDNGIGMSSAIMDKLFKIDACHTTNGTDNEMGTGLGLILCNEFIQKNGGKITVESEPNKGTEFRFTVPLVFADTAVSI